MDGSLASQRDAENDHLDAAGKDGDLIGGRCCRIPCCSSRTKCGGADDGAIEQPASVQPPARFG
jgi:hypothetical protein